MTVRRFRVEGTVQGVGFRPFVHRTASALGLSGWVANVNHGPGAMRHVRLADGPTKLSHQDGFRVRHSVPRIC
ncbi:acylphosphatase [Streptomyces sp. NPDC051913]|uniref:acylphosphatase n=1 Tax=Streptomyces sp. NPDC051913 TaxID=3365676 RepID=UPI0037CDB3AC